MVVVAGASIKAEHALCRVTRARVPTHVRGVDQAHHNMR